MTHLNNIINNIWVQKQWINCVMTLLKKIEIKVWFFTQDWVTTHWCYARGFRGYSSLARQCVVGKQG